MVQPLEPFLPIPLSPQERDSLTDADREKVDAWRFRLHGCPPGEDALLRLYLTGKRAGAEHQHTYQINTSTTPPSVPHKGKR